MLPQPTSALAGAGTTEDGLYSSQCRSLAQHRSLATCAVAEHQVADLSPNRATGRPTRGEPTTRTWVKQWYTCHVEHG